MVDPIAPSRFARALLVLLPVTVALLVACSTATPTATGGTASPGTAAATSAPGTTAVVPVEVDADDFVALKKMTKVRGLFLSSVTGRLDEAIAVANNPDGGIYPAGTIIQLVPQEAMVKREPGFSPLFGDWEFFELTVSEQGTAITKRGGAEVVNRFGGQSCAVCHVKADPKFDFVCEKNHGCDPLPIPDSVFIGLQDSDPRPA